MTVTVEKEATVGSVDPMDVLTAGRELPEGYDAWAVRTVRPDFRSINDYRYPWPGQVAEAPGPILRHDGACPQAVGDGICAATSWQGMASGGVPARTLLLVAYKHADVLGGSAVQGERKLRLRRFLIVDLLDGERFVRESNLSYANLSFADLRFADLRSADLRFADLRSADLRFANLSSANLSSANLSYANLSYANLRSTDLRFADLRSADLRFANLSSANLRSANLRSADLSYANLSYANLSYANLRSTDALDSALWDRSRWDVRADSLIVPR